MNGKALEGLYEGARSVQEVSQLVGRFGSVRFRTASSAQVRVVWLLIITPELLGEIAVISDNQTSGGRLGIRYPRGFSSKKPDGLSKLRFLNFIQKSRTWGTIQLWEVPFSLVSCEWDQKRVSINDSITVHLACDERDIELLSTYLLVPVCILGTLC